MVSYPYQFLVRMPGYRKMEIYDLSADPAERDNLAEKLPNSKEELIRLLPDPKLIAASAAPTGKKLSPETKRRLKALNYTK